MSYTHLTADERFCIAHMHSAQYPIRKIARRINRSPSTISRELIRNKGSHSPYWYDWAQGYANARKRLPRAQKRKSHQPLYALDMSPFIDGLPRMRHMVVIFIGHWSGIIRNVANSAVA